MKRNKYKNWIAVLAGIIFVLNILGCFRGFCDRYRENIYFHIANVLGKLTDHIPFSLGEILMWAGFILSFFAAVIALISLVFKIRRKRLPLFSTVFLKIFSVLFLIVAMIYTFNWILPLRASRISVDTAQERTYTISDLETLRAYLLEHLNESAEKVERDSTGNVVYSAGDELDDAVASAMNQLSGDYPLLRGFYPENKIAGCSAVLDWMDIGGFTYPYTLELTTNRYVTALYRPMLLAHEQSHHKGYYLESEANYLAYLALSESKDIRLQYAAYENMYYYVNNALVKSLRQTMDEEELETYYQQLLQRSDLVKSDELRAEELKDEDYSHSVSENAEKLAPAAESIADKGWKFQSQALGDACYDGVVEMLLRLYDGKLY